MTKRKKRRKLKRFNNRLDRIEQRLSCLENLDAFSCTEGEQVLGNTNGNGLFGVFQKIFNYVFRRGVKNA